MKLFFQDNKARPQIGSFQVVSALLLKTVAADFCWRQEGFCCISRRLFEYQL